jgi:hypothetical protein
MNTTEGFGLDELGSPTTALVEIKKSFGALSSCTSKVKSATNQQLAQLFALSQMRQKSSLDVPISKSALCDLNYSRIALCVKNDDKVLFAITTMYEKASDFVACILFLASDVSVSDVLPYITLDSHVQIFDDETEEADTNIKEDHEEPRNLLLHAAVSRKEAGGGTKYQSRRRPLGTRNENILPMDEDLLDEAKERRLQNLQYIAEWDACRLGHPYLSSANLHCKDRII